MRRLEEDDAAGAELLVGREDEAPGAEDDKGQEVEGRVEVGESVASRRLQDVDAVHVEVLLLGVRDDAGEAVGEHTRQRAHEEDRREGHEDDHQGRAEDGVDLVHDLEADVARAVEDLGQDPCHAWEGEGVASDEGEGGQEAKVDDDDEDHELDKVPAHLLQAGDECSPVWAETEDGEDSRDHEEGFERENVESEVAKVDVLLSDADNSYCMLTSGIQCENLRSTHSRWQK